MSRKHKYKNRHHAGFIVDRPIRTSAFGLPEYSRIPLAQEQYQPVYDKAHWLKTHIEFLHWKKTNDYKVWKHRQFLSQGGTCYYCDTPLFKTRINIDHVIPKIYGGENDKSNLVIACWKCNKDKYTSILSLQERIRLRFKNKDKQGTYNQLAKQRRYTSNREQWLGYFLKTQFLYVDFD